MSENCPPQANNKEDSIDPAEFLLSNPKYHDCSLTVGNTETEQEKIRVASLYLIAQSPVFRRMLVKSKLAHPKGSNIHITDVSPAIFKLMLIYIYGSKLPKMTCEEAAELAICADKYNIQRLVGKACKRLKPTSADDVFPALKCATYIRHNDLRLKVSTIVQQQTDKIVKHDKFLELQESCLLFIVKQQKLNITELELWKNVVRWGESQIYKYPENTIRDCLNRVIGHVRLLTFTLDEIAEYVLPTKVLTSDEFMDLSLAIKKKKVLESPGLCGVIEKRGVEVKVTTNTNTANASNTIHLNGEFLFKTQCSHYIEQLDAKGYSNQNQNENNLEYKYNPKIKNNCKYKYKSKKWWNYKYKSNKWWNDMYWY